MTATATRGLPFDPAKKGQYPVVLSERLLAESAFDDFNLASISIHPPLPKSDRTKKIIRQLSTPSRYNLFVSSTDTNSSASSASEYAGTQHVPNESAESCVLVFNSTTQSFILDRLDSSITFQQKSRTRDGASGTSPLYNGDEADGSDDGLFGEDDKEDEDLEEVDTSNPYDYRHFIKSASQSSTASQVSSRQQSPARKSSPRVKPSSGFTYSPLNGAHRTAQPPKPKAKPKPAAPRTVLPEELPVAAPSPFGNYSSDADDDDVLTIELDNDPPKRKNRFQNAFRNVQGEGPISMRSAASSVSPGVLGQGGDEEEDDGDEVLEFEDAEQEEEQEEESDEDVEGQGQFRLPSPVVGRVQEEDGQEEEDESDADEDEPAKIPVYVPEKVQSEEEEDIDEFERAIARGFEEQEEGGAVGLGMDLGTGVGQVRAPTGMQYESSSESEAD